MIVDRLFAFCPLASSSAQEKSCAEEGDYWAYVERLEKSRPRPFHLIAFNVMRGLADSCRKTNRDVFSFFLGSPPPAPPRGEEGRMTRRERT